ncbi:MAG TPA: carboxypeptidase regulatory-like domain-containing protein [Candidatus Angelobacter sp.]|nr:carboxypeptidase regulatory-like domain-containing protein [Candidatus Angelobacter sp.]
MKSRFWSSIEKLVLIALLILSCSALIYAQSTTDGAIGGTVYDSTGAVVANAKVTVHNAGTNAEQSVTSDASGYYRVTGLQPGSYTVTVDGSGLATYKAQQVIVSVGSVTDVSPRLGVAGTSETVEVTAEVPQINTTSPEFAPTLNQTAIANLPINGGRWSSFALLTPGVVSNSSGFGLLSFRGISTLLNNNTVDGADNNQAFFSEERGRTRAGYSTPKAAIEEFQVNTSNYSSEYGRAAGGVINTVTKSGTNAIHGEAYFYDRDNNWGAINPFTKLAVSTPTGFQQVPYKPTDWRKISGFGLGGPAIKDKLFWNLTFDWYKRNFPGTAVASNPTVFFGQGDPTASSQTATIATIATRRGITTAQAQALYSNEFNGLVSMLGSTPRQGEQYIIFPKVDWTINQKNHASFTFNRMRWASPAGIQTQATNTFGVRSFGDDFVKDTWGIAKLNTFITANMANEVRYQYGRDFEYEFAQQPTPYELSRLVNTPSFTNPLGLPPQVSITNGFTFGVPTFLQRPSFPDESTYQIADTLTWTTGKHSFKFGTDVRRVHDNSQNLRTQFGSYSYSSVNNYMLDAILGKGCGTTATPLPCYSNNGFSQAFGPIGFEFDTTDISGFAADDWKILPRLSVSMGLRYEREVLPAPFSNLINPALPQTGRMPADKSNFGPRLGFAYDVTGNGKTIVRGGYGIYYGRIINSTIFNALTNTGMPGAQKTFSFSPSTTSPVFPTILASAPTGGVAPNVTFFNPGFQAPQIHQFDLIAERDLGWGTVLRVSYLGSLGRELPNFVDTNIAAPTKNLTYLVLNGGPLAKQGPTYSTAVFTSRLSSAFGAETAIFSGANSNYNALSVDLIHRMSHHIQFNANYTWAHALDFGQNESTFSDTNDLLSPLNFQADYGNSIYDVRHRVVLNAVANSPWKTSGWLGYLTNDWTLAPIFQFQTGLPFSLTTSGSAPGSLGGVNGSNGAFRIDTIGRNTFRFPSTYVQDLRLSKTIKYQERYSVELLADVFNLANHTNVTGVTTLGYSVVSTGTVALIGGGTQACSSAAPCLNFNTSGPTPATGSPFTPQLGVPNSANSNFIYSPRQLQLGVRVKF